MFIVYILYLYTDHIFFYLLCREDLLKNNSNSNPPFMPLIKILESMHPYNTPFWGVSVYCKTSSSTIYYMISYKKMISIMIALVYITICIHKKRKEGIQKKYLSTTKRQLIVYKYATSMFLNFEVIIQMIWQFFQRWHHRHF